MTRPRALAFPLALATVALATLSLASPAAAQSLSLDLGEGGVVVETNCEEGRDLLELVGPSLSGDTAGSRLLDGGLVELIDALRTSSFPGMNITRIDSTDPSSIVLEEESGMRILLGSIDLHARRVTALAALSRSIDVHKYAVIDLRLEGEARLVTW